MNSIPEWDKPKYKKL